MVSLVYRKIFFIDVVGMPIGAMIQSFLAVTYQPIRRARKGNAREQSAEVRNPKPRSPCITCESTNRVGVIAVSGIK